MNLLRKATHPDFSDLLVHFTDRVNGHSWLPNNVYQLSAEERLSSILQHRAIWSSQPFGTAAPVVCFSEATTQGLDHLIGAVAYRPWGIVFDRQLIYDARGGPVFHLRTEEWPQIADLPHRLRALFIRFEAGISEWLWEREWRVVCEDEPEFAFDTEDVVALIVGRRGWPPEEPDRMYAPLGDDALQMTLGPPDWMPDCERWWWNPRRERLEVLR